MREDDSVDVIPLAHLDIPGHDPSGLGNPEHPMRIMTRRAAGLAPGGWNEQARRDVAAFFDALAPEWHTRDSPERRAVVTDALTRGDVTGRRALEVGSGSGIYTAMLAERLGTVVALEVSTEMLRLAPADAGPRLLADAAALPFPDSSVDAVVLINAFLVPDEVDRVLAPGGAVVWVNSSGGETPIHLTTAEVVEALPGVWHGVESTAGAGTWCVLRRG
jgi:SAM-dependent methyltransferase